jgi:hypothetical protein
MQIELTVEELEHILIALKDHLKQRRVARLPSVELEELLARLELAERDFRREASTSTLE